MNKQSIQIEGDELLKKTKFIISYFFNLIRTVIYT